MQICFPKCSRSERLVREEIFSRSLKIKKLLFISCKKRTQMLAVNHSGGVNGVEI